ncbi:MAG: hypothetical protein K6C08_04920, partial [Oscillospiraceae bacterium]|nr:hypothetical protein [Oscillospiraceae bacterium]
LRELKQRLEGRGTEDADTIRGRLQRAREELSEADFYRYMIINDDVDKAAADFRSVLRAEHCRYDPADTARFLNE